MIVHLRISIILKLFKLHSIKIEVISGLLLLNNHKNI